MLSWLDPKCPLETSEKVWTEFRMRWLAGKLGLDRLIHSEMILPEPRFFPDPYTGTPADAQRIFDRVCGFMKLEPGRFDVEVLPDDSMFGAAGLYYHGEKPRIALAQKSLADPERLVATIAHELAHDILLGGGLITTDVEDHEHLTDLVPVFLGMGLFAANAPIRDRSYHENNWNYFKISRHGYLPSRMIGYALALFAFVRGETRPAWARYLRPDAAEPLKSGLRFLRKTSDSLFHPNTVHLPVCPPTESEVIDRLATGSPTVRAITLHDIAVLDPPPVALVHCVAQRLNDRDIDVQIEAARVLPLFGEAAQVAVAHLIGCLASRSDELRKNAAAALGVIGGPDRQVVPELTRLLQDPDSNIVDTAAEGLRRFGPAAREAVPALVEAIRTREIDCGSSDALAGALVAINPPLDLLKSVLDPIDPEIRRLVRRALRAARSCREPDPHTSTTKPLDDPTRDTQALITADEYGS
jgi:hypothetical protein